MYAVMCSFSAAREWCQIPGARTLMLSDVGIFVLLSLRLERLIEYIRSLRIVNASSFVPAWSYVPYYQKDEVDWSVVNVCIPFISYSFPPRPVPPLL